MFDIHCHILPGVDDGSGNISDSVEMAKLARLSGIKGIIATPHCNIPGGYTNRWSERMQSKLADLQAAFIQRNISIALYPGQEIFLSSRYLELIRKGELITLNNSRYLLIEFDPEETADVAYRKLAQLTAEGYTPIVAHPERYGFVAEQKEAMYKIKELGALLQINKGSVNGKFGFHAMRTADQILRHRQADFISSDAHSQYSRPPYMTDIHEMICERYSADYADLLLTVNPEKVIGNKPISIGG